MLQVFLSDPPALRYWYAIPLPPQNKVSAHLPLQCKSLHCGLTCSVEGVNTLCSGFVMIPCGLWIQTTWSQWVQTMCWRPASRQHHVLTWSKAVKLNRNDFGPQTQKTLKWWQYATKQTSTLWISLWPTQPFISLWHSGASETVSNKPPFTQSATCKCDPAWPRSCQSTMHLGAQTRWPLNTSLHSGLILTVQSLCLVLVSTVVGRDKPLT